MWLTGLSGAGKSTLAIAVERALHERGYAVYRLDGDDLRRGLNSNLKFSAEDRAENVRRVAEVARLLNEAGVIAIAALISPYADGRRAAREIVGAERFVEVFLDTPIEVCERRDPKGLYKKARSGELRAFTGVSDTYEKPESPDLRVDTTAMTPEASADVLVARVEELVGRPSKA